jgi:carbonic anhydrase
MTAETPPDAAAQPAPASRRFTPKLMIAAGAAAAVLLAGVGGAAVWLWPKTPDVSEAKAARAAARRAAAAASAPAASAALAQAAVEAASAAQTAAALAVAPPPAASSASAPAMAMAAEVAEPAASQASAAAASRAAPAVTLASAEAPLDRLQRRLGEVLGPKGAIEAGQDGELRVLTRSQGLATVRHDSTAGGAASAAAGHAAPLRESLQGRAWSYTGLTGPQAWAKLKPEFRLCAVGQRQSPIDIREGIALDLEPVQFDYRPGSFSVIDTGYTVQVDVAAGNSIEVNGRRYVLQEFHFHRPSEERIDGRQFEMDVHLVHRDAEGHMAVVAVLLERGAAQPLLQTVWNNLPLEKNEPVAARAQLDPGQLLPADRRYYTYMGSMTTPPCTEGVLWLVMQQPVTVSAQQIDIFSRLYPMNARPIQRAAGRMIKQSN